MGEATLETRRALDWEERVRKEAIMATGDEEERGWGIRGR